MTRTQVGGAIVATIITIAAIGYILLSSDDFTLPPPAPITTPELGSLPETTSRLTLPIVLPLESVEHWANAVVDERLSGSGTWEGRLIDNDYTWQVERGPITVIGLQGNNVRARATIDDGHVNIDWFPDVDDVQGRIMIRARPQFTQEWSFIPRGLDVDVEMDGEVWELPLSWVPFVLDGINSRVRREILEYIEDLQAPVTEGIVASARDVWDNTCQNVQLSTDPDLWLEIRPVSVSADQPIVQADTMRFRLGISGQIRFADEVPSPPERCPFPESLDTTGVGEEGMDLYIPAQIQYETARRLISQAIVGKTLDGDVPVRIDRFDLQPYGASLLLNIGVSLKAGFCCGRVSGIIHAFVRPQLEVGSQTVSFADVTLDVSSRQRLVELAGELANSSIREVFEGIVLEMTPLLDDLVDEVNNELAAWGNESGVLRMTINSAVLEPTIDIGPRYLRVVVAAKGEAVALIREMSIP